MKHHPRPLFPFLAAMAVLAVLAGCERQSAPPAPQIPDVLVVQASTLDVPVHREWIGTLDGSENAEIRARVSGYLLSRNYQEGAVVKKGDLLFEIDSRPFQAALAEAKSQLEQGKAMQLASQADAERSKELFDKKVISEREFTNKSQLNQANLAKVQALEASVQQAELNLQFCRIISPIDGIAGVAQAQVGDLVGSAGSGALTTISTLDPIKVIFPISEVEYLYAAERVQQNLARPVAEREEFVDLILADGTLTPHKARLLSVDRQINQATGTILVSALAKNPGSVLRPGQFARARVLAKSLAGAVTVPQRAVLEVQGSYQIGVVGPDGKAEIRPVHVGVQVGQDWVISSGLNGGETVVVEGLQKIRSGAPVNAKPWVPPAAKPGDPVAPAAPKPSAP